MTQLPQRLQNILENADQETLKATIEFAESQL